jgi:predicted GIY-YIG superfamily endonuclease
VSVKIYIKMPKTPLYCNSVIYKLCCKDPSIEDFYVGSTTNFTKRKAQHKTHCNNENSKDYNIYVYQFIRDNGGFFNWDMILIKDYPTDSKRNLEMEERRIIEELKPNLNKNIPYRTIDERKNYYYDNVDKLLKQKKDYREKNKQIIAEKKKIYQLKNKEKIAEQQKEKITCPICGSIVRKGDIARHQRTKKCLNHQ